MATRKPTLEALEVTMVGEKELADGTKVKVTADGQDHSLQRVFPFFSDEDAETDIGKAINDWMADVNNAIKSKEVVGLYHGNEVKVPLKFTLSPKPLDAKEVRRLLFKGFTQAHDIDMRAALKTTYGIKKGGKRGRQRAVVETVDLKKLG